MINLQVLPGLDGISQTHDPASTKLGSVDVSVLSQVTDTAAAPSSRVRCVLDTRESAYMSFIPSSRSGQCDASSVQTYNFTGNEKKYGSITTKCIARRERRYDWRPVKRLPPSHGKFPSSPGKLRPASPLERSLHDTTSDCVMNRWTASFDADRVRFQSISVMCEQRLRKACVMTEHALMPNEFRTMAACEALGTMLPVFKRYDSLVTLVMKELLRSIYEDPGLLIGQFFTWLHPGSPHQSVRAPAEVMLLKSKPYFVRCRELQSQASIPSRSAIPKEKHEGTLLNNLTSARNSMRSVLGKDSLLITRFIFANWKCVVENSTTLRRRFQRARLRVWFSGLRTRLTRRMNQEAKYQLGLRERELMLHASVKGDEGRDVGQSNPQLVAESPQITRAASTCELIVASLLQQASTFMAEVQACGSGSAHDNGAIMASATKMAMAAKLAEERIRLDVGDDMSIEEEDVGISHSTMGTQTESASFASRSGPGNRSAATTTLSSTNTNFPPRTTYDSNDKLVDKGDSEDLRQVKSIREESRVESKVSTRSPQDKSFRNLSKLSRYALQAIVIPDFYTRKVVADASDDFRGDRRLDAREAIEASSSTLCTTFVFESCKGDSFKAEIRIATMKAAVRKHGISGNCRISLFGTLVGWLHEQSYMPQAMDMYLGVMARIFNDHVHQLHARMSKGDGCAFVPLETVTPVMEELLPIMEEGEHFQHRSHALACGAREPHVIWAISEARKMDLTRSLTALARPAGETYLGSITYADAYKTDTILQVVDVDVAMEAIMSAWFEQRHENRRLLAKTIEAHRVLDNGEQRLGFMRFSDMLWELSGCAMSTPAIHRLFKITAVSDKENKKRFSFGQATALSEHILRIIFHVTTDKRRAKMILEEGDDRFLREKARENWKEICMNTTRKSRGQRLRLCVSLQVRSM
ncbi:unnamed protein product [Scytosiphon promiscuus]